MAIEEQKKAQREISRNLSLYYILIWQIFPRLWKGVGEAERSLDTVVRAVSAAVLPVWVDFTSLKSLPCAPGPATTRRGMLVTNG